jgi:uncharacterized protein (TIRG00374 family)
MRKLVLTLLIWLLVAFLLWFALREVDWREVGEVFGALRGWQVLMLAVVNGGIVLLFGARWWVILRAQGYRLPFWLASGYRLAAFSVSYFTPGPHFGGEPLQVLLAQRRHAVPGETAAASVALDKILELLANFVFLAFGVAALLGGGLVRGSAGPVGLAFAVGLAALPLAYLTALFLGGTPLTSLGARLPVKGGRTGWLAGAARWVEVVEAQAGAFVKVQRAAVFLAVLLSGLVWVALALEFWLALEFLGLPLNFCQVISVMTAARLAILLPMPGGLGTLEAALVLVTEALGQGAALGASLSLLIRARDVTFGLLGLWLGSVWMPSLKKSGGNTQQ